MLIWPTTQRIHPVEISFFKLLLILIIVFVIFGAGKLPQVMGDFGKSIRALKDGLSDGSKKPEEPKQVAGVDKDKHV